MACARECVFSVAAWSRWMAWACALARTGHRVCNHSPISRTLPPCKILLDDWEVKDNVWFVRVAGVMILGDAHISINERINPLGIVSRSNGIAMLVAHSPNQSLRHPGKVKVGDEIFYGWLASSNDGQVHHVRLRPAHTVHGARHTKFQPCQHVDACKITL